MTAPHGQGPPVSTIDDFVAAVKGTLSAVGALRAVPSDDLIEWEEGDRYDESEGKPPRIRVLIGDAGNLGPPTKIGGGHIGSMHENARFFVWGAETTADGDRHRAAMTICLRLVNVFQKGRIERSSRTSILTFGEEYQINVEWIWNVPHDAAIWAVPVTPVSPNDPAQPNGPTGKTFVITPAAEIER